MNCLNVEWLEQIAIGIAGGLCVIGGEHGIRWWRHRKHFAPFVDDIYIRTWIDEYHLWETAYMDQKEKDIRDKMRKALQDECCFGVIKLRHMHGRTLTTVADYRTGRGIARGVIGFDSSLLRGEGNYRYAHVRRDYGRYTVDLNPEQPNTITVIYKGTIPTNQAEGYEVWTKWKSVTREMFPAELRDKYDERMKEATESISKISKVPPAEF